jgi:ferredoxin-NADP reductase
MIAAQYAGEGGATDKPAPPRPEQMRTMTVIARRDVADQVIELELADISGAALPQWEAGAHIDLVLRPGLERQYSLCGDSTDSSAWRIAVLREQAGRGGSQLVHDQVRPGTTLSVRGPRNHFALAPATEYIFIAGGIGITPILPMISAAAHSGASWSLAYGGRTASSMAYATGLRDAFGEQVQLYPQDRCGLLDLSAVIGVPRAGTLVYCCGPEPLLTAAEQATASWPRETLRVERFAPRPVGPAADEQFEVELAGSDLHLTVPAGKSLLEVADAAGVYVLSSCQEGICGTCETRVLAGKVDHRDSYLTDEERAAMQTMMICVSRADGEGLVLDL